MLAYDVRPNPALEGVVEYVELEELLREAHLVTLHCPLLPSTFHLLNAERCARLDPSIRRKANVAVTATELPDRVKFPR